MGGHRAAGILSLVETAQLSLFEDPSRSSPARPAPAATASSSWCSTARAGTRVAASCACRTTSACCRCRPIRLSLRGGAPQPVENIWAFLRANHLGNRVYDSYAAVVDACCAAWNALTANPDRITSIATRPWAAVNQ